MSNCDKCRSPGNCCKGFVLQRWFSIDNWKQEALDLMRFKDLEFFVPVNAVPYSPHEELVAVIFDCDRLGLDGRCMRYNERPDTCRVYDAGQDALCAEYVQNLKGIPIRVIYE